jgi:hypothetical protein
MRNRYTILIGKPKGKITIGRPRHRRGDNIKMDVMKTDLGRMDWIHVARDGDRWRALVNTVMNLVGTLRAGNVFTS